MLKAIPIERKKYHCIDSVFLTVAHHFNREIGLMSVGSWGFGYQADRDKANTFGKKLLSGMTMPSRETIHRYHGIDVDWRENVTWEELISAIQTHIKKKQPLGIFINGYYCPWNPVYHKVNVDHYCIVSDYDPETKNYYCVDSYFSYNSSGVFLLPETDLKQGFKDYISFTLQEPVAHYSLTQVFYDVKLSPEDFLWRKREFENMVLFGKDLAQNLDINVELASCNGQVESAPLYRQFIQYSQRRQNFADALRFLKVHAEDLTVDMGMSLERIAEDFDRAAGKWNTMGMLLIKLSLTKKVALREKMGALMEQMAEEELTLLKKVIDVGRGARCN